MNVIHLGSGAGNRLWVEAVLRYPGARNTALVETESAAIGADGSEIPAFRTLGDALENADAEIAVVSGQRATEWATRALQANLTVVMDEVGIVDGAGFRAFHAAATAAGSRVYWPQRYRYARCESVLRRLLGSGRLGGIGHVSCIDQAEAAGRGDGQSLHVSTRGFAHFHALRRLFAVLPRKVMARLGPGPGPKDCTEAFLEFDGGLHVHYSGYAGARRGAHELWVEGSEGSVRTDGNAVWWRKRGWRFFLPLKFGVIPDLQDAAEARATLDAVAATRRGAAAVPADLSAVATVAAAVESHRRRAAVALSEFTG